MYVFFLNCYAAAAAAAFLFTRRFVSVLFIFSFFSGWENPFLGRQGRARHELGKAKQAKQASKQALLMNDLIRVFMKLDLLGNGAEAYFTLQYQLNTEDYTPMHE
jgi:hypothetical protein